MIGTTVQQASNFFLAFTARGLDDIAKNFIISRFLRPNANKKKWPVKFENNCTIVQINKHLINQNHQGKHYEAQIAQQLTSGLACPSMPHASHNVATFFPRLEREREEKGVTHTHTKPPTPLMIPGNGRGKRGRRKWRGCVWGS